ncbi:type VI secretion system tube protein TssD [Marinilabilia salmonicolor]|uniref:type VI secretion system tube protein TssD n=1 Tax=Marinilabilia salmonicolor TaxID=989 RepID=UPI000299E5FA|nr:type VI secretion system tube protein TssD [Marinilabilia salmonicolor]
MFGHKCFLRIGPLEDSSINGLYRDSYELLSCEYGFAQGADRNGKAQSEVRGGTINMVYPNVPPQEIVDWMLKSGKVEDGAIVICDSNDVPLEKVYFEKGVCTNMKVGYQQSGNGYVSTNIQVDVRKISVGNVSIEKRWVNIK